MGRTSRNWRADLAKQWSDWDGQLELTRYRMHRETKHIDCAPIANGRSVVPNPEDWLCLDRGLGDFARFALLSHLRRTPTDKLTDVRRLTQDSWAPIFSQAFAKSRNGKTGKRRPNVARGISSTARNKITTFDNRLRLGSDPESPLSHDECWNRLAAAIDQHFAKRGIKRMKISGHELRWHRFAGHHAVEDFISFINTGIVPLRQAPFPDDLCDFGIALPSGQQDIPEFYFNPTRRHVAWAIAMSLANPRPKRHDDCGIGLISLWSSIEPFGLIAACSAVISSYRRLVDAADVAGTNTPRRRLQLIYMRVGLDSQKVRVSRRGLVRILHQKLCVERARIRAKAGASTPLPLALPEAPSGEDTDRAIAEIRRELSLEPALLIFGIHHVAPPRTAALEDEINETPLPFLLARMMPETGTLDHPTSPDNALGSRVLILADARMDRILDLPVESYALPPCDSSVLGKIIDVVGAPRLLAELGGNAPDHRFVGANELEVALLESILSINDDFGTDIPWKIETRGSPGRRVLALVHRIVDALLDAARDNERAAWLAVLLHIACLVPGGVRRFTIARVAAFYAIATAGHGGTPGSGSPASNGIRLWIRRRNGFLNDLETRELELLVWNQVDGFAGPMGRLVRELPSIFAGGFDDTEHPFESPEVPTLQFNQADRRWLEFLAPLVSRAFLKRFRLKAPQRHALLSRLMSEEFVRRAVIVQCHLTERDTRSLVDQRYVIIAIHQALESLRHDFRKVISKESLITLRWLIPLSDARDTYHWIYHWLYLENLNAGAQTLSNVYGAETFKQCLLQRFLDVDDLCFGQDFGNLRGSARQVRHSLIVADILQSMVHVGVRTCNSGLVARALARLQLMSRHYSSHNPGAAPSKRHRSIVRPELELLDRRILKLCLDGFVSRSAGFVADSESTFGSWRQQCNEVALRLLTISVSGRMQSTMRSVIGRDLQDCHRLPPHKWNFDKSVRAVQRHVPRPLMGMWYDCIIRCAEIVAFSAEVIKNKEARARRRLRALALFELSEGLRLVITLDLPGQTSTKPSPRPVRNAARAYLALARNQRSNQIDPSWCFERAAYYCYHAMGASANRVDRLALLVIQAMTARVRGSASQLHLAMAFLKEAERVLISFPDKRELWIRFYLERAKTYLDYLSSGSAPETKRDWIISYCRQDAAAVIRLADGAPAWIAGARRILDRPELLE